MIEEQLAKIEVAIELNRIPKLEQIIEAQRAMIAQLEDSLERIKAEVKSRNPYFQ